MYQFLVTILETYLHLCLRRYIYECLRKDTGNKCPVDENISNVPISWYINTTKYRPEPGSKSISVYI